VAFTLFAATGCGGGSATTSHAARPAAGHLKKSRQARRRAAPDVRLAYRALFSLPAPLRDPATAGLAGGRFVMLGGLDSADVSSAGIELADRNGVRHTASLPGPQHDAQAATLGGAVYVFGGGDTTELDHILRYDPARDAVTAAGALPVAQSDVAVTQSGGDAYIVGGFDGTNYLNTVVAWHPGSGPRTEAHLPVGLRYSAVAVAGGGLLILGGSTPAGASDGIYRFDLVSHQVRRIGTLRHPVTHAEAATLGTSVYLIGGRGDELTAQTAAIWAIDPRSGRVRAAGHLPQPISDAGVVAIGNAIVVAGGESPAGTLAGVGELVPAGSR
jgi:N-acetylneuraminic acid mutarotase